MQERNDLKFGVGCHQIFDGTVGGEVRLPGTVTPRNSLLFSVGIKASYPDQWLDDLTATVLKNHLTLSSIDYTSKRYVQQLKRRHQRITETPDLILVHTLSKSIFKLQDLLVEVLDSIDCNSSQQVAGFSFYKALGSIHVALDIASKGFLHEVLSTVRFALETLSWGTIVFQLDESEDIDKYNAEKSIKALKEYYSEAGRYYGYLSKYAHWRPQTHTSQFSLNEEELAYIYAKGTNKYETLYHIAFFVTLLCKVCDNCYGNIPNQPEQPRPLAELQKTHNDMVELLYTWVDVIKAANYGAPNFSAEFGVLVNSDATASFLKKL